MTEFNLLIIFVQSRTNFFIFIYNMSSINI